MPQVGVGEMLRRLCALMQVWQPFLSRLAFFLLLKENKNSQPEKGLS